MAANNAALLGYKVFRFTPDMVKSGEAVQMIVEAISADREQELK